MSGCGAKGKPIQRAFKAEAGKEGFKPQSKPPVHTGGFDLTVLDFIGNHSKTFLIAIALNGSRYYDKESLKVAIVTGFANIPGATHIQMDKISQERILEQIDQENFNSMKYFKEEYFNKKDESGLNSLFLSRLFEI